MGLDHGVGDRSHPFNNADSQDGQSACARDVLKAIGEIPFTLTAKPRDPVRRNVGKHVWQQFDPLQEFKPVEQAIGIGGVLADLKLPEPDEPAGAPIHLFGKQAVKAHPHCAVEACGNAGVDSALSRDKRIGAASLDRGRAG